MKHFVGKSIFAQNIPGNVIEHLHNLLTDSSLPNNDDFLEKLINNWLLKQAFYSRIVEHSHFKRIALFKKNDPNGCMAITLSGSILTISPLHKDKTRVVHYTSINVRNDVPETIEVKKCAIDKDVLVGAPLVLKKSAIKSTSAIFGMAVLPETKTTAEQEELIKQASQYLTNNFMEMNHELLHEKTSQDELKKRDDLFEKWVILKWFMLAGLDRNIFLSRAKILWVELFDKLYQELGEKIHMPGLKDRIFLDFTNEQFCSYVDDYKWYESEKKDFDIGLIKALEEIPGYDQYWEFINQFIKAQGLNLSI